MNPNSIIVCPNEKLLQPESIKAFAESRKDKWKLLLIDHHPDLKVRMDNLFRDYIDGKDASDRYRQYAESVQKVASSYEAPPVVGAHLNDWLVELEWIIEEQLHDAPEYIFDQMMAYNTLISSLLAVAVIPQLIWLDARDFVKTDDTYGNPELLSPINWEFVEQERNYVSQANLGSTSENNSTLLRHVGEKVLWLDAFKVDG